MPADVAVRDREAGAFATEVQDGLQDHTRQHTRGPLPKPAQTLGEPAAVGGVVRLPDPPGDVREHRLEMLGPVADLQPGVQEHNRITTFGNSTLHAACVPFQPSVLTVLGAYLGATSRASSLKTW